MDVDLIFRIAAIGIIVSVLYQVLIRSGREEQAMLTSLAGLIVVLMMLAQKIAGFGSETVQAGIRCVYISGVQRSGNPLSAPGRVRHRGRAGSPAQRNTNPERAFGCCL